MTSAEHMREALAKDAPILITGSNGFIGRNLVARLRAMGYNNLLCYDLDTPASALEGYAGQAQFIFHLAGVNRPREREEFYAGNTNLTVRLIKLLKDSSSKAPMILSSTAQAGNDTDYAKSKEAAEAAVFSYGKEQGVPVFVYRLPGVFGKWSRPNYNTVVATFCYNIARGLPVEVRDPAFSLPLCYVDDVVNSFVARLDPANKATMTERKEGNFVKIEPTYSVTLGWLAGTIRSFPHTRRTLSLPDLSDGMTRKLWATYLSFVPQEECAYPLTTHTDERGSFTEFLRTREHGQVSVNVAHPGVVKGNHWHDTKNEKFLVVSGKAVIRLRALGTSEVQRFEVEGGQMQVVDIPPGYTHNIENVGDTDLVTVMWASEPFNPDSPDTYFEEV